MHVGQECPTYGISKRHSNKILRSHVRQVSLMSAEKSTAIVLRVIEFSETSVIVTLMTRDFGKITALAKGARRRKSPFEAALDVLSICRIVFLHKKSQAMDLLTEAKLERRFRRASTDLERLYAGYYVAEILSALTDQADPHPELYDVATKAIVALDTDAAVPETLLRFELGALRMLGHTPMLDRCAGCGREKTLVDRRVNFALNAGGVFCDTCRQGKKSIVSLSAQAWQQLVRLAGDETTAAETENEAGNIELTKENKLYGELRQVVNQYISHLLGYRPRTQKYL